MPAERRSAFVVETLAELEAQPGPLRVKYAIVIEAACAVFKWDQAEPLPDENGATVLAATGGAAGRWIRQSGEDGTDDINGAALTDASATITVAQGRRRELPAAAPLTADRTITVSAALAVAGDIVRVVRMGLGAYTLSIVDATTSTTLAVLPPSQRFFVDVYRKSTGWVLHGAGQMP